MTVDIGEQEVRDAIQRAAHAAASAAARRGGGHYDDYFSEAQFAAWRAVASYEPALCDDLFKWLHRKAVFACMDYRRNAAGRKAESLNRKLVTFTDFEERLRASTGVREIRYDPADRRDPFAAVDGADAYEALSSPVAGRDRAILDAVVLGGAFYAEAGRPYRMAESNVCRVVKKSLSRIRAAMAGRLPPPRRCGRRVEDSCHWCGGTYWRPTYRPKQRFCSPRCGTLHRHAEARKAVAQQRKEKSK